MSNGWSHDPEHIAPQGPADWSKELGSDAQLSVAVRERLRELFERDFAERIGP